MQHTDLKNISQKMCKNHNFQIKTNCFTKKRHFKTKISMKITTFENNVAQHRTQSTIQAQNTHLKLFQFTLQNLQETGKIDNFN